LNKFYTFDWYEKWGSLQQGIGFISNIDNKTAAYIGLQQAGLKE
jgi:hypothetical protein